MTKFEGRLLDRGSNKGGEVFDFAVRAISRKRCEIEPRWKVITKTKSYKGFRLQQKLMTLNDLERQLTALSPVMRVVTERLRLESRCFRYKVALYLSYLHIKFDYEIKGNPFKFQA